ncbi:MAG: ABC transporter ATP-binding protein [SAR324 cluster bacterium]|uniref:ABC transporter ATP-binding protein n=1 Tax=SAR324 cluster bacterium TaxID=2024889 RepID=A0A2A4T666_9DELT|nr:MAG: ABC transporter ATP-binding protein [SAR324 cluster bacterium]
MLQVKNLEVFYDSARALNGVSLEVREGQCISIVGSNGAGKSTLMKAISGLQPSSKGSIHFLGEDITRKKAHDVTPLGICYVLEGRGLFRSMTVLDNLNLGAYHYYKRKNLPEIEQRRKSVFERFPILKKREKQLAGTLSGGEQQMLAIGQAIMARPKLLLLDEPSMGLAPLIVKDIFRVILELKRQGTTVLIVEQNARLALSVSDYAYVMERGQITLEGPGKELMSNEKVLEAYLGGS